MLDVSTSIYSNSIWGEKAKLYQSASSLTRGFLFSIGAMLLQQDSRTRVPETSTLMHLDQCVRRSKADSISKCLCLTALYSVLVSSPYCQPRPFMYHTPFYRASHAHVYRPLYNSLTSCNFYIHIFFISRKVEQFHSNTLFCYAYSPEVSYICASTRSSIRYVPCGLSSHHLLSSSLP